MSERRVTRRMLLAGAGLAAGLAVGVAAVTVTATAGMLDASSSVRAHDGAGGGGLVVTHLPPLLPLAGESVELRYDVACGRSDADADTPCAVSGTVFLRSGSGSFRSIPLEVDGSADQGRYVARVPSDLSSSAGFQYYAVFHDDATGETETFPEGGAAAPQSSYPLSRPVTVDLGRHTFGSTRAAAARVASASWGTGAGQVGLEGGKQETPIGASSFDVDSTGTVTLLDEVNRRALRFGSSWRGGPTSIPLDISGREADLTVEPGGALDVLETPGVDQRQAVLKRFWSNGQPATSVKLDDPFAAGVRLVGGAPVVLEYPSSQWIPVLAGAGSAAGAASARVQASAGLADADGDEAIVFRTDQELRVALVSDGVVRKSWRLLSSTPLAEVQLAEPYGTGVAVVVRVYTDSADEFEVLLLGDRGLVSRFSVDSADWAETAPLARFRLVGSSLYQLGSTPSGAFVDRYALGVS